MYSIDIDYGRQNEIIIYDKLKLFFDDANLKELGYYDEFDYSNDDGSLLCELKSRRCDYNEYNDSMINCSKLNKCKRLTRNKNKKIEIHFFFYFKKSDLYYWKYNETDDIRYGEGGRTDRPNSIKKYAYISRNLLTRV